MAGGPSVFLANKLLDKSLKGTDFTPPGTFYVALLQTSDPATLRNNAIGTADEVPDTFAYARVAITGAEIAAASLGGTSNTIDLIFPEAGGGWGTINYAALMDVATHGSGNVYYFGPLDTPAAVLVGDVVKIPIGVFDIGL